MLAGAGNVRSARLNFGQAGEFFFKFDNGATEFSGGTNQGNGQDRVWSLGNLAETMPSLVFNIAYSASHAFTITFTALTGCPEANQVVGNVDELHQFVPPGPPLTQFPLNLCGVSVPMANHDFVFGSRLEFKLFGFSSNGGYELNGNHFMDDDVINFRRLTFQAGDSKGF